MALIEVLHRRATELGLLPKILSFLPVLSTLFTLISVGLMLYLPIDGQYRRAYISENALMPSQAYSYFRESEWNIVRGYRTQIESLKDKSSNERNEIFSSWLSDFGVKSMIYQNEQDGDTLYGVYNSQRGDGTEAIVLAVPWFNADGNINVGGTALGMALTRYFSRWPIWSKNIILVLSENPNKALKSWVDAYHNLLDLTGGSIEAAIVLDYPSNSDNFDFVEVYYNGLNGELPNLDLVNIAIQIIEHEGMKVSVQGLDIEEMYDTTYFNRLKTLMFGVKNLALSGVRKIHGNEAFSGRSIQAVTLKACGTEGHDITTFGRVPEAIFRSVNNLLEKFHQSFFFYFLLAPKHFISIGSYLPSAVCLSISFGISAVSCLINNSYSDVPFSDKSNIFSLAIFMVTIVISSMFYQFGENCFQPHLMLLFFIGLSFLPLISTKQLNLMTIHSCLSYRLKSVAFIFFSLVLTSLLVMNFSLAFCMGLMAFPMTLTRPNTGLTITTQKIRNSILLTISNPFIAIFLFASLFEQDISSIDIFKALIESGKTLGNWTWLVICLGWFTSWQMVFLSTLSISQAPSHEENKKNL